MASSSRSALIDSTKGLACAAIVWHHLAFYGPMSDIAYPLAPGLMEWLYEYARMAVQVFLVLGGYLAAASLAPQGTARFPDVGQVLGKRFVRLVVPYAVALVVTVLVSALVRTWTDHPSIPDDPSVAQLVANALLLQDIVGEEALSAGVWYVAIDFQLFVLFSVLLAALRRWGPKGVQAATQTAWWLVLAGVVLSLDWFNRQAQLDAWAVYFWGAYGLGALAFWAARAPRAHWHVLALVALGVAALWIDFRARIAVAWITSLALVYCARSPRIQAWQGWAPLIWLGQRSYSVFLVHFAVVLLCNAVVATLWPTQPWINAGGMALAFGLSIAAGWLLYEKVERHVPGWTHALRWQASLVGIGLLVAWVGR